MGKWLRGEKSPTIGEICHPELVQYFQQLTGTTESGEPRGEVVRQALQAKRPVGPALHAAISEALANFALHFAPQIVEGHGGTLIYAGGDDVLALLPTRSALACARELDAAFRQDWAPDKVAQRSRLLMGSRATVSAGLAVVHIREDLQRAIEAARRAERAAKDSGRDALQIAVCRRSGEHASAACPWSRPDTLAGVDSIAAWVDKFRLNRTVSDRWAYHLRRESETLGGLDAEAIQAEIRRQIERSEQSTKNAFPPQEMATVFEAYRRWRMSDARRPADPEFTSRFASREQQDRELTRRALEGFITLCQSASFLARGRDE
jgi:CRISPR-associated protein Cmr2